MLLIGNSIKHLGKPSGEVVVSHADQGEFREFCVKDSGEGIEERHPVRIFKLFRAVKASPDNASTGIGLSLVKRIVERNGGRVRVDSTPGKGSSFFFTILKTPKNPRPMKNDTVLIIDDNSEFIDVAANMFEREGCKVLRASSGREVGEILEKHEGDVLAALFDVDIPGEDPMERYKTIRKLRPETKIVVCTDRDRDGIVDELEKEGVDGVLKKPFKMDDFNTIMLTLGC